MIDIECCALFRQIDGQRNFLSNRSKTDKQK
jgi:hypothetical protein